MADRSPVIARAVGGRVRLDVDAETARDLMDMWVSAFHACPELEQDRPEWFSDYVALLVASAEADVQAGIVPKPAHVPVFTAPAGSSLRLVSGGGGS